MKINKIVVAEKCLEKVPLFCAHVLELSGPFFSVYVSRHSNSQR